MSDVNPYQYSETPGDDHYPEVVLLDDAGGRIEFRPEVFYDWKQVLRHGCLTGVLQTIISLMLGIVIAISFELIWSSFIPSRVGNWYLPIRFLGIILLVLLLITFSLIPWWANLNGFLPRIISKFHKITLGQGHICQFTTHPSRYKGIRRLEDADDIGVLYLEDGHLLYEGDHTTAFLPYSCIESAKLINAGARSMWLLYYLRIDLVHEIRQPFQYIFIGDRAAKTLLGSYRTIRRIQKEIEAKRQRESANWLPPPL